LRTIAAAALLLICAQAASADSAIDALVAAYPDHLAGVQGNELIWKDGTRMPISEGRADKPFEELLENPDLKDQFAIPYPLGGELKAPGPNEDPGRIRNEAFFRKMYGDCRKGEVEKRLKLVDWLKDKGGATLKATGVNQVDARLQAVAYDLRGLPPALMQFLVPSAGTYNCRPVAGTKRLSVHAFGAAIDLSTKFGDYWLWSGGDKSKLTWKNRIPLEIVEIFERHGFIWGGKWYHFDTFHFEYRPEIIALAKQGWPRK